MTRRTSGLGLAAVGAALLLGSAAAPAAQAAEQGAPELPTPSAHLSKTEVGPAVHATTSALGYAFAPAKSLRLDPFAQSSADLLDNELAVKPDQGLRPVTTQTLTGPLSNGGGAKDLVGVGPALGLLPG
ncbi:hypothetical protein CFP65_3138 [Kitasatospora sp. MMS16-BH015]|uniref:hypothetical protein n=1 Tax=Kitasatospora sp. MMS16-BH015 TaxID=2018025 RepID=UPI000CA0ACF0|nr:hypothetical protein [Kitasatospora sp. MMS16-BH015]AUG77945.1 hypothetical protein CFP65_3138 [Kitasatospora sp. MMS16-BH015]